MGLKKTKKPDLVPVEVDAMILAADGEQAAVLASLRAMPDSATPQLNEIFVAADAEADKFDDERTRITKPVLASKKAVDDYFMPRIKGYRAIANEARAKIERHALAVANALAAAQDQARVLLKAGDATKAAAIVARVPEAALAANLGVTIGWGYELTGEPVDADLCSPDPAKIQAYIAGYKGAGAIPPRAGLRFVRVSSSRAKG
jgi:hypothetical protein